MVVVITLNVDIQRICNNYRGIVKNILSNEKYKGDALLQKRYTSDCLTKKLKVNNGEVPQYYIEDDHEAIISPEVFDMVQVEMKNRALLPTRYSGRKVFGSKIKCGDCGSFYGSKVWHSNDKYRKIMYRCNDKYLNGSKCSTPSYSEEELKEFSLKAMNLLITEKEEIIYNIESCMADICDIKKLKAKQEEITRELAIQVDAIQDLVATNARKAQNQDQYQEKYEKEVSAYDKIKAKYDELEQKIQEINARQALLDNFINELQNLDGPIAEFDEVLFGVMVSELEAKNDNTIIFRFIDGTEIPIKVK